MKLGSRLISVLIAILIVCSLTGCSNTPELGELHVVTGIFLDYSPSQKMYQLILEIAELNDYESKKSISQKLLKAKGSSIETAFSQMHQISEKELYFSHAELILLGSGFQKISLKPLVHYLINHPSIPSDITLCMAKNEIFSTPKTPPDSLFEPLSHLLERKGKKYQTKLYSLYQKDGKTFSLPLISQNEEAFFITPTVFFDFQYQGTMKETPLL